MTEPASPLPRFRVVHDEPQPCPYLPGRTARMPLRLPLEALSPAGFDALLDAGDRRAGPLVYRTVCGGCRACEQLRVPVARFSPTRSQRRVVARNRDLEVVVGPAQADEERVRLFNRHGIERGLSTDGEVDLEGYRVQFVESCVDTREVAYRAGGRLVGLSVLDLGDRAVSSVYHCFDPDESWRSLGVYSVLCELAWAQAAGFDWYYLGYWVGGSQHLAYKAQYVPHERLVDGRWTAFETRPAPEDAWSDRSRG